MTEEENRPPPQEDKPWPMKWIVLVIVLYAIFQTVYAIVNYVPPEERENPTAPESPIVSPIERGD